MIYKFECIATEIQHTVAALETAVVHTIIITVMVAVMRTAEIFSISA